MNCSLVNQYSSNYSNDLLNKIQNKNCKSFLETYEPNRFVIDIYNQTRYAYIKSILSRLIATDTTHEHSRLIIFSFI